MRAAEIRKLLEFGDRFRFALHQDAIAGPQRHISEIGEAIGVPSPYADNTDIKLGSEGGVTDEFRDQWRSFGEFDFGIRDFGGNHRFENRRFALDDQVTPALQLAELIDSALDQDAITTVQDSLPAGQSLTAPESDQCKYDQAS